MQFWSSVDLTGNQTSVLFDFAYTEFWSSVDLTGNQTEEEDYTYSDEFWSSVDLTGNQTFFSTQCPQSRFGAVSI